jgi:hypothetical protein
VWQQYAIQENLALQREQTHRQRSTASTGTVAFWVIFALVAAVVVLVAAMAVARMT